MHIAVIPARGGSKRIPRKNIKDFCGKPMIGWSIEAAIASGCFDCVVVSTDDEEIAAVARDFGASVPFIRPPELSDDYTGTVPVIRHAIEALRESGHNVEYACCIYATAPFVSPSDLQASLGVLRGTKSNYAFSVTSYAFPIQRAIRVSEGGSVTMFNPELYQTRSQDLEEAWHDAGQFYWGRARAWCMEVPIFSNTSVAYKLPRHRVQDIDTFEDWKRAELLFRLIQEADS